MVQTLKCPGAGKTDPKGDGGGGRSGSGTGGVSLNRHDLERAHAETGGVGIH